MPTVHTCPCESLSARRTPEGPHDATLGTARSGVCRVPAPAMALLGRSPHTRTRGRERGPGQAARTLEIPAHRKQTRRYGTTGCSLAGDTEICPPAVPKVLPQRNTRGQPAIGVWNRSPVPGRKLLEGSCQSLAPWPPMHTETTEDTQTLAPETELCWRHSGGNPEVSL